MSHPIITITAPLLELIQIHRREDFNILFVSILHTDSWIQDASDWSADQRDVTLMYSQFVT